MKYKTSNSLKFQSVQSPIQNTILLETQQVHETQQVGTCGGAHPKKHS